MSLFEKFDLDIILLIESFCPTWSTRIQVLCIDNPIIFVYLPGCHRLHGGLELIMTIMTGAAIRKAKDIQFLVYTTVLLIAQQSVSSVLQ